MLDSLFEGSAFKMFLVRWFGRERPTNAGRRGRQARLAVVDAANVDGRRKLVLIRRDNLEHLVLIGGPSDVLIFEFWRASNGDHFCSEFCADDAEEADFRKHHTAPPSLWQPLA